MYDSYRFVSFRWSCVCSVLFTTNIGLGLGGKKKRKKKRDLPRGKKKSVGASLKKEKKHSLMYYPISRCLSLSFFFSIFFIRLGVSWVGRKGEKVKPGLAGR